MSETVVLFDIIVESMILLILGLFDEYKVQKTIWNRNLL